MPNHEEDHKRRDDDDEKCKSTLEDDNKKHKGTFEEENKKCTLEDDNEKCTVEDLNGKFEGAFEDDNEKRKGSRRKSSSQDDNPEIRAKASKLSEESLEVPSEKLEIVESKVINFTVCCLGEVALFECQENDPFLKIYIKAAEYFKLDLSEFFLCRYNHTIAATETPKSLNLNDTDILECIPCKIPEEFLTIYDVDNESILLTFQDMEKKIYLIVNKNEDMRSIMERYSIKANLPLTQISFEFDGEELQGHETPLDLDMESGSCIDVVMDNTQCSSSTDEPTGKSVDEPVAHCSYTMEALVSQCSSSTDNPVAHSSSSYGEPVAHCSYSSDEQIAKQENYSRQATQQQHDYAQLVTENSDYDPAGAQGQHNDSYTAAQVQNDYALAVALQHGYDTMMACDIEPDTVWLD